MTKNGCVDPNSCKNCLVRTCENISITPTKAKHCTDWLADCRFTGKSCVPKNTCDQYYVNEGDTINRAICGAITDTNGDLCDYATSTTICKSRKCGDSVDCL